MSAYNLSKLSRGILKRHRKEPPSLTVHLHQNHFRFEHLAGTFTFDSPLKIFLDAMREQRLPHEMLDILDASAVPFYDGCLIVQVHDHRSVTPNASASTSAAKRTGPAGFDPNGPLTSASSQAGAASKEAEVSTSATANKAEVSRLVLTPDSSTLWLDLLALNQAKNSQWTEQDALQNEAVILALTCPPLCLAPTIEVTRLAHDALASSASSLLPSQTKTGPTETEAEEERRLQRERIMRIMDDRFGKDFAPSFDRIAFVQSWHERQKEAERTKQKPNLTPAEAAAKGIQAAAHAAAGMAYPGRPHMSLQGSTSGSSPAASITMSSKNAPSKKIIKKAQPKVEAKPTSSINIKATGKKPGKPVEPARSGSQSSGKPVKRSGSVTTSREASVADISVGNDISFGASTPQGNDLAVGIGLNGLQLPARLDFSNAPAQSWN
ncbi:uncharacterized protein L969DRAFT_16674 [Mixia osmundae IAM 14324]|uniref:Spt20-like SEP domain-containing protein n=1 Tax=Mixia osmundae (strain CBS 9802 / IAM 14324 / JCM 22182 / KY 12970) TaxID=764103 RepID=G7E9Q3_MIXOS|nr:uncharacterized protein L969DRAFT_16674 [Mixia osmundae IAM 14324]KEI40003.1 hypothetical protein L969DRAFT_16674 [Mixia osmundae IAM 14324]GAA99372.1 hypothetical protein E5Q_06068 [Mixia osmundae IAM 14324]